MENNQASDIIDADSFRKSKRLSFLFAGGPRFMLLKSMPVVHTEAHPVAMAGGHPSALVWLFRQVLSSSQLLSQWPR